MLYRFDKTELKFKRAYSEIFILLVCIPILVWSFTSIYYLKQDKKTISEEQKQIIIKEYQKTSEFSKQKLKEYLGELNVKYPEIVLAQAEIETGHFKSDIFKENHNLFGMKEAKLRPTTAIGTNNNHAFYKNWRESVQDYALYQATHLKEINSKEEYLDYLKQNYAEDSSYVVKIVKILKNNKL